MKIGKADVLREWLQRRRALLDEGRGPSTDGRGKPEPRVSRRIERLQSLAGGFAMMQAAGSGQAE